MQIDEIVYSSTPFSASITVLFQATLYLSHGLSFPGRQIWHGICAYSRSGLSVCRNGSDVLCINDTHVTNHIATKGKCCSCQLLFTQTLRKRNILYSHSLFRSKYANVLESVDTTQTALFYHGAETLYWDWPKINSPYLVKNQDWRYSRNYFQLKIIIYISTVNLKMHTGFCYPWAKTLRSLLERNS